MEDIEHYKRLCSRLTLQNKSLGFFKDLLEKVVPFINMHAFAAASTDFDRIAYVVSRSWQLIGAELIFRGKNNEDAVAKRLEGNTAFGHRDFEKALLLFSQSIIKSPPGKDLAFAYANRSAALHKLKEWQLAISDIELAFSYEYPDESRHKLYERMAACQVKLKNYTQAKVVVGICKHFLTKFAVPESEGYHEKLDKLMTQIEADTSSSKKEPARNYASFPFPNEIFPGASAKFRVDYAPQKGRFTYAGETIEPGETVLKEKAFAKTLLMERMGTHCLHCFKKLRAAVGCEICANVAYCSKTCRQASDKYHQYECRVFSLLIGSGMSLLPHLALRMITQTTAEELLAKEDVLVSNPEAVLLNSTGKYDQTSYEAVYNLSALEHQREGYDFLERTIMAIFLLKCLRLVGYFDINLFKNPDPTLEELKIGAILLRNLQILQFNAYEITEFVVDSNKTLDKGTTRNVGLGLFPTAAFFNHSCSPNVTRYFNGATMTVVSSQRIHDGEPISDNYGPLFTKTDRKERQYKLEGRYWFRCTCQACTEDWPTYEGMPNEISPVNEQEKEALLKLQQLDDMFYEDGLKSMAKGKVNEAMERFTKYLAEFASFRESNSSIAGMGSYRTYHLVQDALKLCLQSLSVPTSVPESN